jgi:hypothetical protein
MILVSLCMYGFWIDDQIYWTLLYSVQLHFTVHRLTHTLSHSLTHAPFHTPSHTHTHTHSRTHTPVLTTTSSMPFLGRGFQKRMFPFLWVPEMFSAPSYHFITAKAHNKLNSSSCITHELTKQLTPMTCLSNISARTAQKHISSVATGSCLCRDSNLAFVAEERVKMPQHFSIRSATSEEPQHRTLRKWSQGDQKTGGVHVSQRT